MNIDDVMISVSAYYVSGYEKGTCKDHRQKRHEEVRAAIEAAIAEAVAAERERIAKLCEDIAERHLRSGRYVSVVADHSVRAGGQVDGAEECAAAIRAVDTPSKGE